MSRAPTLPYAAKCAGSRAGGINGMAAIRGCVREKAPNLWFMRIVGNCKLKYFAAQMTTHEDA